MRETARNRVISPRTAIACASLLLASVAGDTALALESDPAPLIPATRKMSLRQAVATAVAGNPGVLARAQLPIATRSGEKEALAAWEPLIKLELGWDSSRLVPTSALAGTEDGDSVLSEEQTSGSLSLSKLLRSGTTLDLSLAAARRETNSSFQGLVPEYRPSLGLGLEQPLLRNRWGVQDEITLKLARNDTAAERARFAADLADFVFAIAGAYWDVVLTESRSEATQLALQLARNLAADAEKRVQVGMLAPVAVKEARAEAASREEQALSADNEVRLSLLRLAHMVRAGDGRRPFEIQPAHGHEPVASQADPERSLALALARRPELRLARLQRENRMLGVGKARDDRLPSLSLSAGYTLLGAGGRAVPISPFDSDEVVSSPFGGSWSEAIDLLADGDFNRWSVGLSFELPLARSASRARLDRAQARQLQADHELEDLESTVILQLDRARADLASAWQRVQAARLAVELADENLHDQRRRFEEGMVTTTDVLDFQQKLADSMAVRTLAVTDHARAEASQQRAQGTLLEHYGVKLEGDEQQARPWWASF